MSLDLKNGWSEAIEKQITSCVMMSQYMKNSGEMKEKVYWALLLAAYIFSSLNGMFC